MEGETVAGFVDIVTGGREPAPEGGAAQVPAAATPPDHSLLGVVVAVVAITGLYFGRDVLIPITLAGMLSFVLSPVVDLLQKAKLWRGAAVMLTVLAALGVLGLVGTLLGSQAASLTADAPKYAQTIEAKASGFRGFAVTRLASLTRQLGDHHPGRAPAATTAIATPFAAPSGLGPTERPPLPVSVVNPATSPFTIARTILAPILGPMETIVIVLIITIFVLMQREDLRNRFIRVFGSSDLHRTTLAIDDAGQRLSRYFLSQVAVNTSFGIVIGGGLWLIGIPSPGMWGVLAGLLRFVPYIGSFLAAVAPMALGAAIEPGWGAAIYVALLFVIVEPLTGYVVEPLLYGHSTGLSPVSVIVAAIFWTWVWGPIGLIMSTPLTLCLVVMGRHVKSLEFFDVLLGDRPPLTAVETFYQRILADDPDEALAQAEAIVGDRSPVGYYDEVVLPGLRLAADDEARGTLGRDRIDRMSRSIVSVVQDLPPAARTEGAALLERVAAHAGAAMLCVAGRGAFDRVLATMIAEAAERIGLQSRIVRHAEASREAIGQLDTAGVSTIVVAYLDPAGSPAQLRYLVKRLHARAPDARIVVGLWPTGRSAASDEALQSMLGADACPTSVAGVLDAAAR